MDIAMKAVLNSKKRSIEDWMHMFGKSDPWYKIVTMKANDPPDRTWQYYTFGRRTMLRVKVRAFDWLNTS